MIRLSRAANFKFDMAGHNKWSKVKRLKAVTDKKKSALYAKYIKEISIAAKQGGTDPDGNARLRKAITDAKAQSVPKENIERALKKAAGELDDGANLEEIVYEGYGPGGVAILVECVTDKKTRTQPELRKIFEKGGGSIAEAGAVAWGFEKRGLILIKKDQGEEERLMNLALDSGADDFSASDEGFEILSSPQDFLRVVDGLEKAGVRSELSELSFLPKNRIQISGEISEKLQALLENLEDHDDVQRVTSNADF